MAGNDKIRQYFVAGGYSELPLAEAPTSLLWRPNFIFTKDGFTFLILIKSNNSVPPAYLDRISQVPNDKFVPLILFGQAMPPVVEKEILTQGISIGYAIGGNVSKLKIRRRIPKQVVKKEIKKKKLTPIDIFVSSRQQIEERPFIEDRLEMLRKTESYPFNPPKLIEHDRFRLSELYSYIDHEMGTCDWVVIALEDEYSDVVSYEIKKAVEIISHENVFMFVKSTAKCKDAWKSELELIKSLPDKSIKYIEYNNKQNLEIYLTKAVKKRMVEIQTKMGIKVYE